MSGGVSEPAADSAGEVAQRLAAIRERIAGAGGDASKIAIVAVTKGQGPEAVRAALGAGLVEIGENYATELLGKIAALEEVDLVTVRWHFLGAIQRNKIARLGPVVSCWQGVSRAEEAIAIGRRSPGAEIFVEVATGGDPSRPGCSPADAPQVVEAARAANCQVRGLMTVAPLPDRGPDAPAGSPSGPDEDRLGTRAAEAFGSVAELARELGLSELSMGMSEDLEQAVAAGTTMIRVGRALFGERQGHGPRESASGLQE